MPSTMNRKRPALEKIRTIKERVRTSPYRKQFLTAAAFCTAALMVNATHIDDAVAQQFTDLTTSQAEKDTSIWLNNYSRAQDPMVIQGISELSGLTWNDNSKTLFAVINRPARAVELSRDGQLLRAITLNGFEDVEGITWMGGENYLIADERKHHVLKVTITPETKVINSDNLPLLQIGIGTGNNKGFEGIAWQPDNRSIWVIKERDPITLYHIKGFADSTETNRIEINVDEKMNQAASKGNSDASGLHLDSRTGNLLVLSDESARVTEINRAGEVVSTLSLGWELNDSVPQAEGITMDDKGDIYIVSEPNLMYRYSKTAIQK